jgi:hypothetical protein
MTRRNSIEAFRSGSSVVAFMEFFILFLVAPSYFSYLLEYVYLDVPCWYKLKDFVSALGLNI